MTRDDELKLSRSALYRSAVYAVLARCFGAEPSQSVVAILREPDTRRLLMKMGVDVPEMNEESLEALAAEYTRLFLGPGEHIPPYESVFTGGDSSFSHGFGEMHGESYFKVRSAYAAGGVSNTAEFTDLEDHLGAELDFLRLLAFRESQAWKKRSAAAAVALREQQFEFLRKHPGKWIAKFAQLTIESARIPFYAQMAALARDFVKSEIKFLREPVEQLEVVEIA